MFDKSILAQSPLSIEEIQRIDSSGLPIILRHRIRLLAHCLACFKTMNNSSSFGELPSKQDCLNWLLDQPSLSNDREFVFVLLEQFVRAELHLKQLSIECKISPLELTLGDLIDEELRVSKL